MAKNIVEFIEANPGCNVSDILNGCGHQDAAETWGAILDAHRTRSIEMEHPEGGKWAFFKAGG